MSTIQILASDVKLSAGSHGIFHVNSSALGAMHSHVTSDVNYSRRLMAAILSEAIGTSYFDCDELTLSAVACEVYWTPADMSRALGYSYRDEEYIAEIFTLFHG